MEFMLIIGIRFLLKIGQKAIIGMPGKVYAIPNRDTFTENGKDEERDVFDKVIEV